MQDAHDVVDSVEVEVLGSVGRVSLKRLGRELTKGQPGGTLAQVNGSTRS